jgi:hypothetical protein
MIAAAFVLGILTVCFLALYLSVPSLSPEGGSPNPAKTAIGFATLILGLATAAFIYFR